MVCCVWVVVELVWCGCLCDGLVVCWYCVVVGLVGC